MLGRGGQARRARQTNKKRLGREGGAGHSHLTHPTSQVCCPQETDRSSSNLTPQTPGRLRRQQQERGFGVAIVGAGGAKKERAKRKLPGAGRNTRYLGLSTYRRTARPPLDRASKGTSAKPALCLRKRCDSWRCCREPNKKGRKKNKEPGGGEGKAAAAGTDQVGPRPFSGPSRR